MTKNDRSLLKQMIEAGRFNLIFMSFWLSKMPSMPKNQLKKLVKNGVVIQQIK